MLIIGSDVHLIECKLVVEEINSMNNNVIGQGKGTQDEVKKLATQCVGVDEDVHMPSYKEFWDGFYPYTTMNSNEVTLLHTLSLQQNDSRIDSSLSTCPIALGHKRKLSIIEEITLINSLNDMECHSKARKNIQRRRENILKYFSCAVMWEWIKLRKDHAHCMPEEIVFVELDIVTAVITMT